MTEQQLPTGDETVIVIIFPSGRACSYQNVLGDWYSPGDREPEDARLLQSYADDYGFEVVWPVASEERAAPNAPGYYSISEAAEHTGLNPKTIRRMIARGDLAARRVARRILIPVSALAPDQLGEPANSWAETGEEA